MREKVNPLTFMPRPPTMQSTLRSLWAGTTQECNLSAWRIGMRYICTMSCRRGQVLKIKKRIMCMIAWGKGGGVEDSLMLLFTLVLHLQMQYEYLSKKLSTHWTCLGRFHLRPFLWQQDHTQSSIFTWRLCAGRALSSSMFPPACMSWLPSFEIPLLYVCAWALFIIVCAISL